MNDQALTNENVPVIVERCITHIHMNGVEEKGIYRTAGQNSKVQELLDQFRRGWSCFFFFSYFNAFFFLCVKSRLAIVTL